MIENDIENLHVHTTPTTSRKINRYVVEKIKVNLKMSRLKSRIRKGI
jgi:hypothetical protein